MDESKLSEEIIPAALKQQFLDATVAATAWTSGTVAGAKQQLKEILFQAQNGKCAYCRRFIRDEPGHVEIDHILPQNSFGKVDFWSSNESHQRKSTGGYPNYRFIAHNLALTCKRCNNKKGTYDSRRDRSVDPSVMYDLNENYYEWVHIYAHYYYDHIKILKGLIYQIANDSPGGAAVISICKLDEIAAVERGAAELMLKDAADVAKAIALLLPQAQVAGWEFVIDSVANRFADRSRAEIERIASEFQKIMS